jgi:peptidoglycan/LPS O-acetylase OafA/YrhL
MRTGHALSYRPDIDGLRAVAVTLVILVHAFPSVMQNGFIGVDIFFVISGFLITRIILTHLKDGSFSLLDFYVRRINRIFPALIALLGACIAFGWISLYANEFGLLGRSVATGAGFVANINYYFESGYWDIAAKLKPLLHLWSLGVEEQFYLIWPLLLWAAWSWRRQNVAIALLGIMVLSLAWNLWITGIDQPAAFYLPFGRLWELGAGGALAYIQGAQSVTKERGWINEVAAFSGFTLIVVALAQRYPVNQFPGAHAILPVLGAVLIIGAGAGSWLNAHLLSQRAIVYVGLISFPLYLWHWPALAFARILNNGDLPDAFRNAALALTVALAVATYHAIEQPIGTHRHWRGMIAAIACVLLVACGAGGYAIYAKDGLSARYGYSAALPSPPPLVTKAKVALIGDSFAGILHAPLHTLYGDRLVAYAIASWPYLAGVAYKPDLLGIPKVTPEETEKTLATIMSDATIDAVVIFNASYTELDYLRSYPISPPGETAAIAYEAALRRTVKLLTNAGKRVVYVKANPFLNEIPLVEVCSSTALPVPRRRPIGCILPVDVVRQRMQHYNEVVDRALDGVRGVSVLDTTQLVVCDERLCYVERNGALLYRDQAHLSPIASLIVAIAVAKLVESQAPGR